MILPVASFIAGTILLLKILWEEDQEDLTWKEIYKSNLMHFNGKAYRYNPRNHTLLVKGVEMPVEWAEEYAKCIQLLSATDYIK